MKKLVRISVIVLVVLAVIALFFSSARHRKELQDSPPILADTTGLESAAPVIVDIVQEVDFKDVLAVSGVLEGWHHTVISSETGGRIVEWTADVGDDLLSGQVIVRLDDEVARYQNMQAEAAFEIANVSAAKARRDMDRFTELHDQGDLSDSQLDDAKLAFQNAQANLKAAEAASGLSVRRFNETAVKMPFDGTIAVKNVEVGQSIAPGMPVAEVVQIAPIRFTVGVSEQDIIRTNKGQSVSVTTVGWGERVFHGTVTSVATAADGLTRLFPVEIKVPNRNHHLKPGMAAKAEIVVANHADAITLPINAIIDSGDDSSCYVVESGRAVRRVVTAGELNAGTVRILAGLSVGDTVIVVGQDAVKNGQKVELTIQ